MANFETAYHITMKNEGGYCNTPGDSGGETWKGIARNYHLNWEGWMPKNTVNNLNRLREAFKEQGKAIQFLEEMINILSRIYIKDYL